MSTLLEVDNISVAFDGFKAINGLSFEIGTAELRAIIGPNGAGKTTMMDIVTGKTKPDSGDVRWGEKSTSLLRKSESQIAQLGIGRKFQKPTTFEEQSVYENLLMALANNRNPFAVLGYRKSAKDEEKITEIAALIKLDDSLHRAAGELSHGQKQWLEIGMLLAQEPRLLLVDEPAAGMTASERGVTVTLLKDLAKTRSIVVVEHDMEFIRQLECRVTVLHEGAVLAEGSLDFVTKSQDVIDVYLGR
ncbi:urea ABC transporter ATP-binding protein UrtD [Alphaproteobacteria bacterium]|nr:urea ABC transporter ATP-binding protein UrtD [Alphaproteobacteria bacterium]